MFNISISATCRRRNGVSEPIFQIASVDIYYSTDNQSTTLRVCMELWNDFPPDIRVRREASYLTEEGWGVVVLCQQQKDEPNRETIDGIEIIRSPKPWLGIGLLEYIIENLFLIHPRRYRLLSKVIEERTPDILHVHDLPPIRTGLSVADGTDIPVVVDLHELYPEFIAARRRSDSFTDRFLPSRVFKPSDRYKRLERKALENKVSGLVTVSPEQMDYYRNEYDLSNVETAVVRNVPDIERLGQIPVEQLDYEGFVVGYVGNFDPNRDLETVIKSFEQLLNSVPEATLLMIGSGSDNYVDSLKKMCVDLGISDDVEFTGWVDFERIPSYINACDATLCTFASESLQSEYALPNKIFQSMFMGTPVVVSDLKAMRNVVEETNSGISFEAGCPSSLADALLKLHDDPELQEELGKNGRQAIKNKYNFGNEVENLIDLYERIRG